MIILEGSQIVRSGDGRWKLLGKIKKDAADASNNLMYLLAEHLEKYGAARGDVLECLAERPLKSVNSRAVIDKVNGLVQGNLAAPWMESIQGILEEREDRAVLYLDEMGRAASAGLPHEVFQKGMEMAQTPYDMHLYLDQKIGRFAESMENKERNRMLLLDGLADGLGRGRGEMDGLIARMEECLERKEQIGDMLGIRREEDFQKDVEGALSRQHGRLHMQDNEKMADESRMSGISMQSNSMVKSPAKVTKEVLAESKPSSGTSLAIKKRKKKKMLEHFLAGRNWESRRGAASLGRVGRGMAKISAQSAGMGAKAGAMASNPGGWVLLVMAGVAMIILTAFLFILLVGSLVSGGDGQASSAAAAAKTFSAKVESYRGDVAVEARKYGMEGYINLFLAMMEVESHGNGNDVFQCSESLGLPRNSLPIEKSIAQGVKYLTSCIRQAKAKSPSDLDGIRLAVQGYNFGNGYIPWAVKRDGGWTQENALEFARIHSKGIRRKGEAYIRRAGPWNYGDQYYADHVMEYYGAEAASAPAGACAKIPLGDRMKWLFPDGVPKTSSQMKRYLIQVEVPILNREGKDAAMKLTVHKKLAEEIKAVFQDLKSAGIRTIPSCTAAYNWRKMATNSSKQSHHSYGSVVDWNWTYNPICYPGTTGYRSQPKSKFMADQKVVGIWKSHGFYWGGDWKSYRDYMHFSYTNH